MYALYTSHFYNALSKIYSQTNVHLFKLGYAGVVSAWYLESAADWAEEIKYLLTVCYPDSEKIILVMDNLNTHTISCLYKKMFRAGSAQLCQEARNILYIKARELAEHSRNRTECHDQAVPCAQTGFPRKSPVWTSGVGKYEEWWMRKSHLAFYCRRCPQ